jgi:thiol:disulfide interchange protein
VVLTPVVAFAQANTATVAPLSSASAAVAGNTFDLAVRVTLPDGLHSQSNKPKDESLVPTTLTFEPSSAVTPQEVVFPPAKTFKLETGDTLLVFERAFVIGARVAIAATAPEGPVTLNARLRYQPCNDVMCFRPVTVPVSWTFSVVPASSTVTKVSPEIFAAIGFGTGEPATVEAVAASPGNAAPPAPEPAAAPAVLSSFALAGSAGGYMNVDAFLTFIHNAEAGVQSQSMFADRGPIAILLLVFIGGLALNLTPCVLPMIPINLAIIGAGAKAGDRRRGFALGSAYGAAMALVYGVLGVVVIRTASTFGTINASPWFNAAIAVLFVVLGLAMFDIGAIDFSRLSSRIHFSDGGRGTVAVAFGMGAVAALLAGACVAPVVIQVVVFASDLYAKGSTIALALPFVLGLGMALPWPVAGAGLSRLPKPGAWMNTVKYVFGAFILTMAAYYGYLTYEIVSNRWVNQADVQASAAEKLKEGWYASLDEGLSAAAASRQPVLIDMWATWCKNCLTMDKTTLADPRVKDALAGYVKIKFQAEDPDAPGTKDVMQRLNGVGLPAYGILKAK